MKSVNTEKKKEKSLNVVLDTNVFISAILWKGIPHKILKLIEAGKTKCYATVEMLTELEVVLGREKFTARISDLNSSIEEIFIGVLEVVEIIKAENIKLENDELPADEDDIMFIQCAITANANYLVSGDEHLLSLNQIRNVKIVRANQFYNLLSEWGN